MLGQDVMRAAGDRARGAHPCRPRRDRRRRGCATRSGGATVINCAAYTERGRRRERAPTPRGAVNAEGAGNVAASGGRGGGRRRCYISTDYVFDGGEAGTRATSRRRETGPLSALGTDEARRRAKRQQAANPPRCFVVRSLLATRRPRAELRRPRAASSRVRERGAGQGGSTTRSAVRPGPVTWPRPSCHCGGARLRIPSYGRRGRDLLVRARARGLRASGVECEVRALLDRGLPVSRAAARPTRS